MNAEAEAGSPDREFCPPGSGAHHDARIETAFRQATLFGRRRGKKLTARHSELMQTALSGVTIDASKPIDLASLFPDRPAAVWIEVGFGGGEHLAAIASAHPEIGFIGCEAFRNGIAKALMLIEDSQLRNVRLMKAMLAQ